MLVCPCVVVSVVVVALVSRGIFPHLATIHMCICVSLCVCVSTCLCAFCAALCACNKLLLSPRCSMSSPSFSSASSRPAPQAHPHLLLYFHRRQALLRFITFIIIEAYSPFNICRIYLGTFRAAELAFLSSALWLENQSYAILTHRREVDGTRTVNLSALTWQLTHRVASVALC